MSMIRAISVAVLCLLSMGLPAWAQNGVITGKATDASGAVLPGVELTLTSASVMGMRNTVSDEQGIYRFDFLPPGSYTLKFELPGFRSLVREGIQMTAGFTATLNATMEVASAAEAVTVVGESPVIDVQNAVVATNFTQALTQVLPTGHDVFSVLAITPGVQVTAPDVGGSRAGSRAQFRVFGSVSQWNVIDGAIMASLQYEDPDVYQEVQIAGASKGADAPVGGSFNNFIVKTGSNRVHGLVFYDREPLSLQGSNLTADLAAQGVTNTSAVARYQSFHADAGGPFIKDKFWWFYSFRKLNSDQFSPGFLNASGQPEPLYTTLRDQALKLNYQLNTKNGLAYSAQYNTKIQPNSGGSAFVPPEATSLVDFPYWVQGVTWNSVLSRKATLEVKYGEFGWKWWTRPGNPAVPMQDLDTQQVRGGRPAPFIDRSHHWNISPVLSLNMSGSKVGSHNFRFGYMYLFEGAPYTFLASNGGSVQLFYRGGFKTPAFIETYDTPFTFENDVTHNSSFINDTWNLKRLTLNLGFRFDSFMPYYPTQGKNGSGPWQDKVTYQGFNFPHLNGWTPRLSFAYDVFGNGKTAIKASYARYVYNAGTITNANSMVAGFVNPMAKTTTRYIWDGTLPFLPDPSKIVSVTGGPNRALDPNLKLPYTEEYLGGIDQQITPDMTVRFNFVQKFEKDRMRILNRAIPFSAYDIPVTFTDPGRPGLAPQPITVFSLERQYVGQRSDLLTNDPANSSTFTTYNVEVVKRMSKKWQLLTGLDVSHYKTWQFAQAIVQDIATDTTGVPQDPNRLKYNAGANYWHWQYKALGSYDLPYGVGFSTSLRLTKGEPYGRTLNTPSLTQGVVTLQVEPSGSSFYDTVGLLDLRFTKSFSLGESLGKLEGIADAFNISNSAAVLSRSNLTGPSYNKVLTTMNPRIFRFGVRWNF